MKLIWIDKVCETDKLVKQKKNFLQTATGDTIVES